MVPEPEDTAPQEQGAQTQPDQDAARVESSAPADAAAAAPVATPAVASVKPEAAPAKAAADESADQDARPEPTPETCRGIAIGQAAFEDAVLAGEFEGSDFMFYLEPAGVLNANLICSRDYPAESTRAGILMTKAARDARTVFFNDGINPDKYELHFPKEFGYVKSLQHYEPASREHAKYPWSKKY